PMPRKNVLDNESLRRRLESATGRTYWRTLDELADTAEFRRWLEREFPEHADEPTASRRDFLKLMGASLALAGLSGCLQQPEEMILPYVQAPEEIIPGKPLYFATAMEFAGRGVGLVVESHMGRPTKIEGNPDHPASAGATGAFAQAAVLDLYDPDRSQVVRSRGRISTGQAFLSALEARMSDHRARDGEGLYLLTEPVSSPTLRAQLQALQEQFPQARGHRYEAVFDDDARDGARLAFGDDAAAVEATYRFDRAERILSLDADFLFAGPWPIPYARQFMQRRRIAGPERSLEMNRLYVAETSPTPTGAKADHRLTLRPAELFAFAWQMARALEVDIPGMPDGLPAVTLPKQWPSDAIELIARDLREHAGRSLIIAGPHLPPFVQALAHAMNEQLGNVGETVLYRPPLFEHEPPLQSLASLVRDLRAGEVETLIVLGGNPAFTAPADLQFAALLEDVPFSVHLSLDANE
ncbi:MAG: TAT-variant-translocated molybdopterin oxidoreductase, partial [Planctomycetaceae bacterium]